MDLASLFALLTSLWGQFAPVLALLQPVADLLGPVLQIAAPVIDIFGGPLWWAVKWLVLPFYALWFAYLAIMSLKRSRDAGTLTGVAYALAVPFFIAAYALDIFVNLTGCTVVFFDAPREKTMTARLKRYAAQPGTWRFTLTVFIATHFLDRFDPDGYHVAATYETAAGSLDYGATEKAFDAVNALEQRLFAGRTA